jgi:hypothetical protein
MINQSDSLPDATDLDRLRSLIALNTGIDRLLIETAARLRSARQSEAANPSFGLTHPFQLTGRRSSKAK